MRNLKLFSLIVLGGCVIFSCSKEQSDDPSLTRKGPAPEPLPEFNYTMPDIENTDDVMAHVESFLLYYKDFVNMQYEPDATPSIDAETAVWYAEAAYNYINHKTGWEENEAIDIAHPIEHEGFMEYIIEESEALVSESALFSLFSEFLNLEIEGEIAPYTNLELVGSDGGNLVISGAIYKIHWPVEDPIQDGEDWQAVPPRDCNSNGQGRTVGARISEVMLSNHLMTTAWAYSVHEYFFGAAATIAGPAYTSAQDYAPLEEVWDPVNSEKLFVISGSGTQYLNHFWGAPEAISGVEFLFLPPDLCLYHYLVENWVDHADDVVTSEPSLGHPLIANVTTHNRTETSQGPVGPRHQMTLTSGIDGPAPANPVLLP